MDISDQEFDDMIAAAMDRLPKEYITGLKNVAIVISDIPSPEQRQKLELAHNQSLYGLYEGVPLTRRGMGYNLVLPDKITLFKLPLLNASHSKDEMQEKVTRTLWHEIAHYYGLDHHKIRELETKDGSDEKR